MRTFRFLFAALIVAVPVAACGDHLTIPPDKTGACVNGLLEKCNGDCVDLQTSLTNCGKCGVACNVMAGEICVSGTCKASCPPNSTRCSDRCVDTNVDRNNCGMCGKACAINEVCAKGTCAATCEAAGYITCNGVSSMLDAGGAKSCVDPLTDNANCGSCGNVCAGMLTCSNGVCCPPGQIGCNGQCTSPLSDPNHCGGCGKTCNMMEPNCVAGVCSKCKPDVLVLSDGQVGVNQNMNNALKSVGFRSTVIDGGATQYTGTPAATDFSAIVVTLGNQTSADLPQSGQQAIVNANNAGVGVVLDGWLPYAVANGNRFQTLKSLSLLQYAGTNVLRAGAFVVPVANQQPWFDGLPGAFSTVNQTLWMSTTLINNATQVAKQTTDGYIAEAFRGMPNGRVVHLGYGMNSSGAVNQWTNDANMTQWTINAVRYAAGCTP